METEGLCHGCSDDEYATKYSVISVVVQLVGVCVTMYGVCFVRGVVFKEIYGNVLTPNKMYQGEI